MKVFISYQRKDSLFAAHALRYAMHIAEGTLPLELAAFHSKRFETAHVPQPA